MSYGTHTIYFISNNVKYCKKQEYRNEIYTPMYTQEVKETKFVFIGNQKLHSC